MELLGSLLPRAKRGISLAETVIALGLLGIVLLPTVMFSSGWFLKILSKDRQNVNVSYGASQFINQLTTDMSQTLRLQSNSDSTHLYYAYYDPIQQTEVQRGYQLSSNSSGSLKLEQLIYSNGAWTAKTAFAEEASDFLAVPTGTTFTYCANTTCSTATTAAKAVFIRLSGWQFYTKASAGGTRTLTLPITDIYMAAGTSGEIQLSEKPRQLSAFTASSAFGSSNNDLTLAYLNPNNTALNTISNGNTAYTTIYTGISGMYVHNIFVDPVSHVVAFDEWGGPENGDLPWPGAKTYIWSPSDGLSTQLLDTDLSGTSYAWGTVYQQNNNVKSDAAIPGGGLLLSANNNNLYQWGASSGLSTVKVGAFTTYSMGGASQWYPDPSGASRIYLTDSSYYYRWSPSTGFSTINSPSAQQCNGLTYMTASSLDGRLYFSNGNNEKVYSWNPSTGLSTTITAALNYPVNNLLDTANGRLFGIITNGMCTGPGSNGRVFTWDPSSGLSTIFYTSGSNNIGVAGGPAGYGNPAPSVSIDPVSHYILFSDCNGTCSTKRTYLWSPSSAMTILITNRYVDWAAPRATGSGGFYFMTNNTTNQVLNTWIPGIGVATLGTNQQSGTGVTSDSTTGMFTYEVSKSNDAAHRVVWSPTTGLSTIGVLGDDFGGGLAIINPVDGYVYASDYNWGPNTSTIHKWSAATGTSTLAGPTCMGDWQLDKNTGRVFFSDFSGVADCSSNDHGALYTYPAIANAAANNISSASMEGVPLFNSNSFTYTSGTRAAAGQAVSGEVFIVNSTGKTLDRYSYSSGTSKFTLTSQMNWSTWSTSIAAVAVDQASSLVALLDNGNKQIDVYSDRTVSGTPAAPTALSISGTTTPTGLAMSPRTGNYLVLDSSLQSSTNVRLFVYNSAGTLQNTITIDVTSANLTPAANTETNFKIAYNDRDNTLYLMAPTLGYVYVLTLPKYL